MILLRFLALKLRKASGFIFSCVYNFKLIVAAPQPFHSQFMASSATVPQK